jgi:hypothetical protein
VVLTFPYFGVGGSVDALTGMVWLGPDRLVFAAAAMLLTSQCQGCPRDTIPIGRDLVLADLSANTPTFTEIPGTLGANSVATDPGGTLLYFTREYDTRILSVPVAGGTATPVHDFGPGRLARDVQASGNLLAAVVGGAILLNADPTAGPYQLDAGGELVIVDLTSGQETLLTSFTQLYRRPALAPSGLRLAAEGYHAVYSPILDPGGNQIGVDTVVSRSADLWLLEEP